jgi:hypothetical protein
MNRIETLSLSESNDYIINLLSLNKKFMITRIGVGNETNLAFFTDTLQSIDTKMLVSLSNNAGIYNITPDNLLKYAELYIKAIKESNALATFNNTMIVQQEHFINNYKLDVLYSRVLEPFYCCLENIKPWTQDLQGKKVLIVNPFVKSFKKQLKEGFQIFKDPDKKLFMDNQDFVFYKSYNTAAGNSIHKDWEETYDIMCKDISKLDFDIALLGCGGYGLPLCNFIYKEMNKSAIYVGGGLQLLFGVMGKRWDDIQMWMDIIKENDSKFIRPSINEQLPNKQRIEGGCYW